jgi:hypothetical protein
MRSISLALFFTLAAVVMGAADTLAYHAGFVRVTVQDAVPFDVSVWYPASAAESPFLAGPFGIDAALIGRPPRPEARDLGPLPLFCQHGFFYSSSSRP